jgi:hypothetical protein
MLILMTLYRILSVGINTAKLLVEKTKWPAYGKHAANIILSLIPPLCLVYVIGFPHPELILFSSLHQLISSAVSYCSLKTANYLRSFDLISHEKGFSGLSYLSKIFSSTALDIGLTLLWSGPKQLFMDSHYLPDKENIISYCKIDSSQSEIGPIYMYNTFTPLPPLISIWDKAVALGARMAVDLALVAANKLGLGLVKDLRSPFWNTFAEEEERAAMKKILQARPMSKPIEHIRAKPKKIRSEQAEDNNFPDDGQGVSPRSEGKAQLQQPRVKHKTRSLASRAQQPAPAVEQEVPQEQINFLVEGENYYRVLGAPTRNCNWYGAVKRMKDAEVNSYFEKILAEGAKVGDKESIKHLKGKEYELGRRTEDERMLGTKHEGPDGPYAMHKGLHQSLVAYERLKEERGGKEPTVFVFDQYVSTHSRINKSLAGRIKNAIGRG